MVQSVSNPLPLTTHDRELVCVFEDKSQPLAGFEQRLTTVVEELLSQKHRKKNFSVNFIE